MAYKLNILPMGGPGGVLAGPPTLRKPVLVAGIVSGHFDTLDSCILHRKAGNAVCLKHDNEVFRGITKIYSSIARSRFSRTDGRIPRFVTDALPEDAGCVRSRLLD